MAAQFKKVVRSPNASDPQDRAPDLLQGGLNFVTRGQIGRTQFGALLIGQGKRAPVQFAIFQQRQRLQQDKRGG